ncbi:hypothetical protein LTR66_016832 [Elasticomyces elasticus]|nr:hypothetical protein LTR66_016832 [Elasticomyces elasticus]
MASSEGRQRKRNRSEHKDAEQHDRDEPPKKLNLQQYLVKYKDIRSSEQYAAQLGQVSLGNEDDSSHKSTYKPVATNHTNRKSEKVLSGNYVLKAKLEISRNENQDLAQRAKDFRKEATIMRNANNVANKAVLAVENKAAQDSKIAKDENARLVVEIARLEKIEQDLPSVKAENASLRHATKSSKN